MNITTIGFIGFGLIGGSIAKAIKKNRSDINIMAYMRSREKLELAKKEGMIDVILDGVDETLKKCDVIFLCAPVEFNAAYLNQIKPYLKEGAFITDVGSTKMDIHKAVTSAELESYFVGGHPMAGSEKTGCEHATDHLLENAYYIITPTKDSSKEHIETLTYIATLTGSIPVIMDCEEHDRTVAGISHLPHLIAASLVNLVKNNDGKQHYMKQLAAGGFKDITRIASSSPEMWEQICMTNTTNIALLLKQYIDDLSLILENLNQHNSQEINQLFVSSGTYRNTISDHSTGSIRPEYSFSVDIVDEPGAISTLSVILSARGISMSNIGINHNRMYGEGALKISFYDEESMLHAWEQLRKYNYELIKGK